MPENQLFGTPPRVETGKSNSLVDAQKGIAKLRLRWAGGGGAGGDVEVTEWGVREPNGHVLQSAACSRL